MHSDRIFVIIIKQHDKCIELYVKEYTYCFKIEKHIREKIHGRITKSN